MENQTEAALPPLLEDDKNRPTCPHCKALLVGRHCLAIACGYSKAKLARDCGRLPTLEQKANQLISVMLQYNLTLPKNAAEWRVPPSPVSGYITGITRCSIRLLLTDGIVAWFAYDDGTTLFGHMAHFVPDKESKASYAGPRKHKKKPVDPKIQALADED